MVRSPFCLIQEDCLPDEWLVLVCCILLNQTTRKQVDAVFRTFLQKWNAPQKLLDASNTEIAHSLSSLGFQNRRVVNLKRMTEGYLAGSWVHASDLVGIGEYGNRCHQMMCRNVLGSEAPKDHALKQYYEWRKFHEID